MQTNQRIFDPNFQQQQDYALRSKIYARATRTATLARKQSFGLNAPWQNQRWQGNPLGGIPESGTIQQQQYTYGANFNTDFNAQFDALPRRNSLLISMEPNTKKGKESVPGTKPKRAIGKSLRFLRRIKSSSRRRGKHDPDYLPPSNLFRLFGETSLPGVRDIALSRSFLRRIFWVCSFFFFSFLALRDISQLVSEYYTYPITVDVRLRDSRRLQFPAVTVCNLNIVRYSALCLTNVSVIKDSMIPRDLREKLCGFQPIAAKDTVPINPAPPIATTTIPPPTATTSGSGFTTTSDKKQWSNKAPVKKSTPVLTTTSRTKASNQVLTTTVLPTDSDGLDDINNYGEISKHKLNETSTNGTGQATSNRTTGEGANSTMTSTTTIANSAIDVPNDISLPQPQEEHKERTKRRIKMPIPKTSTGSINQSIETPDANSTINETTSLNHTKAESTVNEPMASKLNKSSKASQQAATPATPESENEFDVQVELTDREEKELQENMTNWLAVIYNSNERIAQQLGHQFEDFVLRCTIRSTNCTSDDYFERFFTPTEGSCFTFKSQKLRTAFTDRIKDETSIAGVNYGLELVLNLEISEYLTGTTQIGAIIMIQHPDEIGISASEAIFVAPQQSTYIGLKMMNISRLPKPYPEDCIDHWPAALIGRLTQNASYSQQACLKICLQRTIHLFCKCQSAMLPQLELNSTLKICDTRRRNTRKCVEDVMFQAEDRVSTCKCPPRCQVINYDKTVSMTRWPTREDKVTFDRGKAFQNFQNLAKVTIYFQTMTCQEVRQEKSYTTARLFSSLGGILGMYVGFSFLSLFEILEVFFRRFWFFLTTKKGRFRTAVHAVRAAFAFNPKRPAMVSTDFGDKDTTTPVAGKSLSQVAPALANGGRYPSKFKQTYQHGIV